MESNNTFIDIERFVKWTFDNPQCFYGKEEKNGGADGRYSPTNKTNWRTYKKMPLELLKEINLKHLNGARKFETINISDFLLCANMAKDHNRGNKNSEKSPISSTGKKVLMMLLLGRTIEEDIKESVFSVKKPTKKSPKKESPQKESQNDLLYKYLSRYGSDSKIYYYFPGRTISFSQLDALAKRYNNRITSAGIKVGLNELVVHGLVERVTSDELHITEEDDFYKLNFDGCYQFMISNKKIIQ